jgi:transmembrane sensor
MTEEEKAKDLLKRFTEKIADPAEANTVEEWYASSDQKPHLIDEDRKETIRMEMLGALKNAMAEKQHPMVSHLNPLLKIAGIAAAILISANFAINWWWASHQPATVENLYSISTSARETKRITLSDGSEIKLFPSSTISYRKRFSTTNRSIELTEGEAFFNIAHEPKRPFMVNTLDHITTKVLGTSFSIQSYKARRILEVKVATGKVSVGNAQQEFAVMVRGQQLSYDKEKQRAEVAYNRSPLAIKLNFHNVTLQEAVRELQYAYSITINLENKEIAKLKCTADFTTKQEAAEILEIICALHHLRLTHSANSQTFKINTMKR